MNKSLWLLALSSWLLAISLFSSHYSLFPKTSAQGDAFSLGIYPPVIEINTEPPANIEAKIHLQNLSDLPQNLKIILKSFRPSERGDGSLRYISKDTIEGPDPLILQKIKVYDQDIALDILSLDPFESRELTLKVNLDSDDPLGDYYFSVIFVSQDTQDTDVSQSQIPGGIGTNVILSVGQKGIAQGEIKEFSIPPILSSGPVPITLLLQNNSKHYVVPTGRVIIRDMLGREAGQVSILPQYILANSDRFMIDTDQASPSASLEEQISILSKKHPVLVWPKKFLFGIYTAYAHVKLSENGPVFETKTSFVALPIYMLFAISFLAFVLIGIYLKLKRKI
ncbi:MAG: hypothetical protein HY427_00760 [Candidatus Levybacteria bacterium]|nr:hypothetical protein [Candidatus Levybacteria bacterium]